MGIFWAKGDGRVLDKADSHVGPAELDGGVRPPIHLQVHLLGLDHISASRHWRPGKIREMEHTTQRALELHMRGKWAERLLAHFAPFAEHIAYMQEILGEDFRKEALDLLGDSRFRTLRQHCLVYESLRKSPWQERHVRSLLNQLADEEVTPCKLRQVWNTLKWFSKTFGLLKIDELHRLKSKKSSLEEALTDTVTGLAGVARAFDRRHHPKGEVRGGWKQVLGLHWCVPRFVFHH